MARQRKRRPRKTAPLTPEVLARLLAAMPEFQQHHERIAGMGMALSTFRTWPRKDGSTSVRAVWRGQLRGINTSFVYSGGYA